MKIAIASGKGGTGKTTLATNLACALPLPVQLLDCDVEEPNAHLFLKPEISVSQPVGLPIPKVDPQRCTLCGQCAAICQYSAIITLPKSTLTFPELCHHCGGCVAVCPEKAIVEEEHVIGHLEKGTARGIAFVHGRLKIGQAMSPPLIRMVKAQMQSTATVIVDAPPGTTCPVIQAVRGCDYLILVTEPTPFGLHDLHLAVQMARELKIPCGVVINRSDLGDDRTVEYCRQQGLRILLQIPAQRTIAEIYSRGEMAIDVLPDYQQQMHALADILKEEVAP